MVTVSRNRFTVQPYVVVGTVVGWELVERVVADSRSAQLLFGERPDG
jgi:hypothetical protein